VLLDTPAATGARLVLAIQTLDPHPPMRFPGEVRWCVRRDGRYATGVSFVDLPADATQKLQELFHKP
jgi:hypothetical protein